MLSKEQAQKRLTGFSSEALKAQRAASFARLPSDILGPMALDEAGRLSPKAQYTAACHIDALAPGDRLTLFDALFGRLAPYVDRAWDWLKLGPYQTGYYRKPFRAPRSEPASRMKRFGWLESLRRVTAGYDQDLAWFAAWAPYLVHYAPETLGVLFAAAIDAGDAPGQEVFDLLRASARGEHEIGAMGRHVTRALLSASRPDGWELVESMLLAAQREEGLRQVILETIDESHPEAFRRMLRLILDQDLTRFSAVVRAVDVWFGFGWDAADVRAINKLLQQTLTLVEDPEELHRAYHSGKGEEAYLALWTMAFRDAVGTIEPAAALLADPDPERRYAAAHLLAQLDLVWATRALLPALDDTDRRVTARVLRDMQHAVHVELHQTDLFEKLEQQLPRFPRKKTALQPILWPWVALEAHQGVVAAAMISSIGDRPPERLIPYLPVMDIHNRHRAVEALASAASHAPAVRAALLGLLGDPSYGVREAALRAIAGVRVTPEEAREIEGLLARKAGDLRRGAIAVLLTQDDPGAIASAERLLDARSLEQQLAGLELLHQLTAKGRAVDVCRTRAARYRDQHHPASSAQQTLLDAILSVAQVPTLEDGLGLCEPGQRTRPLPPVRQWDTGHDQPSLVTRAALDCLRSLDQLVDAHRTTPCVVRTWEGPQEDLLGNLGWRFPGPTLKTTLSEDVHRLPLKETWEAWWRDRPQALRDPDGLEILRALAPFAEYSSKADRIKAPWLDDVRPQLFVSLIPALQYPTIVHRVLLWLMRLDPPPGGASFLLDAVEFSLGFAPHHAVEMGDQETKTLDWRNSALLRWLGLARYHRAAVPDAWEQEHDGRLWPLLRWIDEPLPGALRHRPLLAEVLAAVAAGAATEADIVDYLLGPRVRYRTGSYGYRQAFRDLSDLSRRRPSALFDQYGFLRGVVERCRERIIEVELARGDLPTAASDPAAGLRWSGGMTSLLRLLQALDREGLVRKGTGDRVSKAGTLSHLIHVSFPEESDTPEAFAAQVATRGIPQRRLVELAMDAPHWAAHIEQTLRWPGLAEAVWWIYAHTRDRQSHVDEEVRDLWVSQVSERTPLSSQNLLDGAVDVAWFYRAYEAVGSERWRELYEAAKYASEGAGHQRARKFADALTGRVDRSELVAQITQKRNQDAVRALGLVRLSQENTGRDILERYRIVQEFLRTGRKFGAQRQASEQLAASTGLENLARNAGYPDPIRLEWAMEAREIGDLGQGPVTATVGDVSVSLAIDRWGDPSLVATRGNILLKSIPANVKRHPQVVELQARQKDVRHQASRVRLSLESAMCRGGAFTSAELTELASHPVVGPMLRDLVFSAEGSLGYPVDGGRGLVSHDGAVSPVLEDSRLRIAHPSDLLATNEWHHWQQEAFLRERIQPFKQVFRELYVLTEAEKADGAISRRYAGHQVHPKQAVALLGKRGWVFNPEEGVGRTFHELGFTARLSFLQGAFTPAEVEGVTIEGVRVFPIGKWQPVPLVELPPRVFSEVMRDIDLVVSVAHRGGVDPEASASTVELRSALVRETCGLLKIDNVELQGRHALIEGKLGSYSVHLSSGVVHRQPGGAVCIVPVHAQHRGHLFLPFADDDPRTAEVLSKVLMLARDAEIKDPTILEQILG